MPYIAQKDRIIDRSPQTVGELNWHITDMIDTFLLKDSESYTRYNAVIGVLECAKLELYRRLVATYEDKKIKENGDVYYHDRNAVLRSKATEGAEAA